MIKRLFPFIALLLFCSAAHGQDSKQYVRHGTGVPSICPLGTIYVDDATGNAYANKLGSCQVVGGATNNPSYTGTVTVTGASGSTPGVAIGLTGDTTPRVAIGLNSSDTPRFSAGPGNALRDTFFERAGVAYWRFGSNDAASPVAQTLGVQNVVAGTSNTAGADWTLQGSQGTGTGSGGKIIFKVAPAGSTGTAQNALSAALTINGDKSVVFSGSVTIGAGSPITSSGAGGALAASAFTDTTSATNISSGSLADGRLSANVPLLNAANVFTSQQSAPSFKATGTGGLGFFEGVNQSSAPSTPTSAGRIFWDSLNRLSWIGTNGFTRTFDGTANTTNRVYVLPDASGTIPLLSLAQTWSAAQTFQASVSTPHLIGLGSSPSIVVGTGAGTGATASVSGTDLGGVITLTSGISTSGSNATMATVTFATAFGSTPSAVVITSANAATDALFANGANVIFVDSASTTTTQFVLKGGTVAPNQSTTFKWHYIVVQ